MIRYNLLPFSSIPSSDIILFSNEKGSIANYDLAYKLLRTKVNVEIPQTIKNWIHSGNLLNYLRQRNIIVPIYDMKYLYSNHDENLSNLYNILEIPKGNKNQLISVLNNLNLLNPNTDIFYYIPFNMLCLILKDFPFTELIYLFRYVNLYIC